MSSNRSVRNIGSQTSMSERLWIVLASTLLVLVIAVLLATYVVA